MIVIRKNLYPCWATTQFAKSSKPPPSFSTGLLKPPAHLACRPTEPAGLPPTYHLHLCHRQVGPARQPSYPIFLPLCCSPPVTLPRWGQGGGRELAPAPWLPLVVLVPRNACHASRNRHPPSISRPPNPSRSPIRLQAPSNLPVRRRFGEISPKSPTVAS
jgi:hypothetical protein